MARNVYLLILFSLLCGCAAGDRSLGPASFSRDSAGIRIVDSQRPSWPAGSGWRISGAPLLEIGHAEDLHQVRGVFRLSDDRIVVANGGSLELLLFDAEGQMRERIGRGGSGPEEFREFTRVRRSSGDSLVIFDLGNARITVIEPGGTIAQSRALPVLPNGSIALVEDVFGDGSLLVTPAGGPPTGNGLTRRTRSLWRIPSDSGRPILVAEFPELEMFFFEQMPRPISWRQPFFGQTSHYTAAGDRVVWGSTESFEIYSYGQDGSRRSIYRWAHVTRTYGSAEVSAVIDEAVAAYRNEAARPSLRAVLQELPRSGVVPAWGWPDYSRPHGPALQLDTEGNLWVAEYHMPGNERNTRTIIDSEGVWLGTVALPDRFSPHHIGADFVLGVWRDEFDVEIVRLYQLIKARY